MMKRYLACRRLQKWLMVDGQWSMVNAEEMEQHLAECPRCAAFLREQLPIDARDHFVYPTRHLISRED